MHRISRSLIKFSVDRVRFRFFAWKQQTKDDCQLSSEFFIDKLGEEDVQICVYMTLCKFMSVNKRNYETDVRKSHDYVWMHYNRGVAIVLNTASSDSRRLMEAAGIDIKVYKSATICHAAILKWRAMGLSRERVTERTFRRLMNISHFIMIS